jgi:hypothetical protein
MPRDRTKYNSKYTEKHNASRLAALEIKAGRPCPTVCELCGSPPSRRRLNYDHNHITGEFRGWICESCNLALGLVQDSTDRLRAMIEYLETEGL